MLYRGTGAVFSPYAPHIDAALGAGFRRKGFFGDRAPGKGTFASTDIDSAMQYVGDDGGLFVVEPLAGAHLTWVKGVADLVLSMESWMRWESHGRLSRQARSLLADVSGDSAILDTYLALRRQRRAVAEIVDAFLAKLDIREILIDRRTDLAECLGSHRGEVWVTGPLRLESLPLPLKP